MLLTGEQIKELGLVRPCLNKVKCQISYGLEPSGYTIRLDRTFRAIPSTKEYVLLDPKNAERCWSAFEEVTGNTIILPPKSFILGKSIEYIKLPNNVTAIALTKSTYARLGVFANITVMDAGWEGVLVIEIANLGRNFVKLYAGYGIAELLFFEHKETGGYEGKYQRQEGIRL